MADSSSLEVYVGPTLSQNSTQISSSRPVLHLEFENIPPPDQNIEEQQRRQSVRQAVATLSAEQQEVIALGYFYGLSQSEIAGKLRLPLGTVKTRMRLGMIKLREVLAPHKEEFVS